jgi:putative aldouronate transport system permease protein
MKTNRARSCFGGDNASLNLFVLPGLLILLFFAYIPLTGLVLVFKEYNFMDGLYRSPWVGLKNFAFFFQSFGYAWRATRNTLFLNFLFITFGTLFALFLAVCFSEFRSKRFTKVTQSILFLPNFISWIIIGGIFLTILDFDRGLFNRLLAAVGLARVDFNITAGWWPAILTVENVWKGAGYSSVVYYAVLTNIDPGQHEAAQVDGASRVQRIWHVALPALRPTVVMLTILSIGRIFYGDLTMMMGATRLNPMIFETTDIIDTFVYRSSIQGGEFSMASAVGLYQSLFGFVLVVASNWVARKVDNDYRLF